MRRLIMKSIISRPFSKILDKIVNRVVKYYIARNEHSSYLIKLVKNPSEDCQLTAVRDFGWAIQYIDNPSEKVQVEAVKQIPTSIKYIKNPCEEAVWEALKEPYCSKFIENMTYEMKEYVIKRSIVGFYYIRDNSEEMKRIRIKHWGI